MATALSATPPDFATAMDVYELGKNAPGRTAGTFRTLKGKPAGGRGGNSLAASVPASTASHQHQPQAQCPNPLNPCHPPATPLLPPALPACLPLPPNPPQLQRAPLPTAAFTTGAIYGTPLPFRLTFIEYLNDQYFMDSAVEEALAVTPASASAQVREPRCCQQ
jgi:hypothetical protein